MNSSPIFESPSPIKACEVPPTFLPKFKSSRQGEVSQVGRPRALSFNFVEQPGCQDTASILDSRIQCDDVSTISKVTFVSAPGTRSLNPPSFAWTIDEDEPGDEAASFPVPEAVHGPFSFTTSLCKDPTSPDTENDDIFGDWEASGPYLREPGAQMFDEEE